MSTYTSLAHNSGRRRATDRQQPRKSKREHAEHTDKYAEELMAARLSELVRHFNGEEADRG
ncbi:hypothetical protein [Nocardioides sp. zg-DK7169]|uniref:hypothetical protein n=1 Tax=Nocardioides sp. zg-DK7169 TaxID=2736600 RepID=UPI0015570CA6|nr:hypothetical protein [Nocardioides sp. zg-DK7169]NPC97884.1 hypothetical protein [Nocardioides sp. zg-DK7169]